MSAETGTRPLERPSLAVVLSLDGLSWSRLEYYRPWYVAGLKRLLEEGQVETGARYRHLNTETSPGHAALATGAPPRVTGVVANRWIEQNPDGSLRSVGAAQPWATDAVPGQPPLFYREVEKDGRLYVFALARELELWEASGETGRAIVAPRRRARRARPSSSTARTRSRSSTCSTAGRARASRRRTTVTGPGNLRVPTLGDRLVEASPRSRVVVVSGKDRTSVFLAGPQPRGTSPTGTTRRRAASSPRPPTTPSARRARRGALIVARFNAQTAGTQLPARFGTLWERLPAPDARVGFGARRCPAPASGLWDFQLPTNGLGFPHDLRALRARLLLRASTSARSWTS